jgi:hypothetical protein
MVMPCPANASRDGETLDWKECRQWCGATWQVIAVRIPHNIP